MGSGNGANGKDGEKSPDRNGGTRNTDGTFKKGHSPLPGAGRPKSSRHELVNRLGNELVTEADAREVWQKLIQQAKAGEPWAIKEFLDRTIGKAKETVDISGGVALSLSQFFREAADRVDAVRN